MFYHHKYILSQADKWNCMADINYLFDSGQWANIDGYPRYQTFAHIFDYHSSHWQNFRQSFLDGCLKKESKNNSRVVCWAYKNYPFAENKTTPWHDHIEYENSIVYETGIYYLSLPENAKGTRYMLKDGTKGAFPIIDDSWTYFPTDLLHKPFKWKSKKMTKSRVTIVALAVKKAD